VTYAIFDLQTPLRYTGMPDIINTHTQTYSLHPNEYPTWRTTKFVGKVAGKKKFHYERRQYL